MKTIISFVAALFWFLLLAETSLAADWYCSTSAQGLKDGTSWANAWACNSNAPNPVVWGSSGVKAGDSLYIDGGSSGLTYTATANALLNVGASGTSENRITIATGAKSPYPSGHDGQVIFDGGGTYVWLIKSANNYITFNGGKNGTRNWKLYNTKLGDMHFAVNLGGSNNVIFTYIEIEKCNSGIAQGWSSSGGEFSYLYIHDLRGYAGIYFSGNNYGNNWYDQTFVHHCTIEINSDTMDGNGAGADGIEGCPGLTVYNCTFNHVLGPLDPCDPGVYCVQHSDEIQVQAIYVKIYNNVFKNPTDSAIDLDSWGGTPHGWFYIYNNLFYVDNLPVSMPTGIRIYSSDVPIPSITDAFIIGNTFVDLVGSRAVTMVVNSNTTATNVHIKNNLIYDCGSSGNFQAIMITPSTNAIASDYGVDYNLVRAGQYGNAKLTIDDQDNYVQPHGYSDIDPTFVSYSFKSQSNNFHLSASDTGARDRGVVLGSPFNVDKDGNLRPASGSWDIGAYEYASGGTVTSVLRTNPSNPRYFTDGSGKSILLVGSHTWANLMDQATYDPPPAFDYNAFLDFLQAHNHNFFRLWTWTLPHPNDAYRSYIAAPYPWRRTGPGDASDGKPRFDLNQLNQDYFDRVRARVIAARQRGIYVSIMLFQGFDLEFMTQSNDGNPFASGNNVNGISCGGVCPHTLPQDAVVTSIEQAYLRKVVDTVNDLDNVLYEVANEAGSYSTSWQYSIINYVKEYEASKPKQHPIGMTFQYTGGSEAVLDNSPADWVSPGAVEPPESTGNKVKILDTDHACYYTCLQALGQDGQRAWIWKNFLRGYNLLFMDPYLTVWPGRNAPNGLIVDPYWDVIRIAMGYTKTYADRIDLTAMTPHGSLSSTGYALASPGSALPEYLVYTQTGGTFTVNLDGTSGQFSVEWMNPTSGAKIAGGQVSGGTIRTFTTPFSGDAVLYLKLTNDISDTQPPTVDITSPTGGIVSGIITISASASDNVSVSGVQFKVDGSNIGPEDTTAPYSISWDSSTVSNGSHTLSATARDAAGNTNTSQITVTVSNQINLSSGLVAAYSFDEGSGVTATDSSGNGNTGTLINGPTWTTGKINGALSFDGANDYVDAGSPSSLDDIEAQGGGGMTVSAWIYNRADPQAGYPKVIVGKAPEGTGSWGFYVTNGLRFWFQKDYTGNDLLTMSDTNSYSLNAWHHVVVTWNGNPAGPTDVKFYVDGNLKGHSYDQSGTDSKVSDAALNFYMGRNTWGNPTPPNAYFNGTIDEVRIYNRVLSPQEISGLYSQTSCIHKSDTNCDSCISSTELTAFIDQWKVNSSNPTLRELIEAIGLWKKGCS